MTLRCKAGDVCVIVAEIAGCEMNIGAMVTLVELWGPSDPTAWLFKDASRAIRCNSGIWTYESEPDWSDMCHVLDDGHLVPIRGDEQPESISTDQVIRHHAPVGEGHEVLTTAGDVA